MGKVVKIFLNQGFTPIDNSLFRRGTLLDFDCYIQRFNGFAILIEWLYRRTWTPKTEILGHFGKGYF